MATPVRLLIADDHPLVRSGVRVTLSNDARFEIVGEARDAAEAQQRCVALKPDVLLLDVRMPGPSALDTIRWVRERCPGTRIVALTAEGREETIRPLIQAGIDGYVHKSDVVEVLEDALMTVVKGGRWFSRNVLDTILAPSSGADEELAELSPRERELVACIAQGWDNPRIERELGLSAQSVRNYVSRIYEKVGVASRPELVVWAQERGFGRP